MELKMSRVLYEKSFGRKVVRNVPRIRELSKLLNISICSTSKRSLKSVRNFAKCRGRAAKYSVYECLTFGKSFPQISINTNQKVQNLRERFERYKNFSLNFVFRSIAFSSLISRMFIKIWVAFERSILDIKLDQKKKKKKR